MQGSMIGARIRERLDDMERTPAWLGQKIGVHRSLVIRWLSGERTIPEQRRREIALVLGKDADWLAPARATEDAAA